MRASAPLLVKLRFEAGRSRYFISSSSTVDPGGWGRDGAQAQDLGKGWMEELLDAVTRGDESPMDTPYGGLAIGAGLIILGGAIRAHEKWNLSELWSHLVLMPLQSSLQSRF